MNNNATFFLNVLISKDRDIPNKLAIASTSRNLYYTVNGPSGS
jgi:hypothetical protein